MAQYKVPQDVEADDKLLGPFTFRQFIYLLIASGSLALAWAFFQVFPLLALLPFPIVLFFGILALPLKKDQPMETYFAALIAFYLKPRKRLWTPGQSESSILITAPKQTESNRIRNLTGEEATHRLSFLADLVDSEGYSIKDQLTSSIRPEYLAEANSVTDMLEDHRSSNIDRLLEKEQTERHQQLVHKMREAIRRTESLVPTDTSIIQKRSDSLIQSPPNSLPQNQTQLNSNISPEDTTKLQQLSQTDYSIQTIQQQAARVKNQTNKEIFISLR